MIIFKNILKDNNTNLNFKFHNLSNNDCQQIEIINYKL